MKLALEKSFGIQCPQSILNGADVLQSFDFEGNYFSTDDLNKTAFCGRCAAKNSFNLNIPKVNARFVSLFINII